MIFGIDFGTSNTVVARMGDDERHPSLVRFGRAQAEPSLVSCDNEGRLVFGKAAIGNESLLPGLKNILRDAQVGETPVVRIGDHTWDLDEVLQGFFGHIRDAILADQKGRRHQLPERLPVVVTVPQNCTDIQRRHTRSACEAAGFEVLRVLNEPTSAAVNLVASDSTVHLEDGESLLVYDFGGGTFDVTLLRKGAASTFTELDCGGIQRCGGGDIDLRLHDWVLDQRRADPQYGLLPWKADQPGAIIGKLQRAVEQAKLSLSEDIDQAVATVSFANVVGTRSKLRPFTIEIGREQVAEAARETIAATIGEVRRLLRRNEDRLGDLTCAVMTGGSSQLPGVQVALQHVLAEFGRGEVEPVLSTQPLQDVALGASRFGALRAKVITCAGRHFGVRRVQYGTEWTHVLLAKGTALKERVDPDLELRYRPEHDVGEFCFFQCGEVENEHGEPADPNDFQDIAKRLGLRLAGDVLRYPRPLRIPFDPALGDLPSDALDAHPISSTWPDVEVVEAYRFGEDGLVDISIEVNGRRYDCRLDFGQALIAANADSAPATRATAS